MTDLQNKYDILLEDIKLLLQYDDKYMKIGKTKLVKPNILNELEKKISDIKQQKSGIALQIKDNNDKKELLTNDISSITIQNTNIEREISELNNNTKIIQEEQQSKLDLLNSKCKELEEFSNTIQNQLQKDMIKQILKVCNNNHTLLSKNIFQQYLDIKYIKLYLLEMYLSYISDGIILTFNHQCMVFSIHNIKENNAFKLRIENNKLEITNLKNINENINKEIRVYTNSFYSSNRNFSASWLENNDKNIINYQKTIKDNNINILNLENNMSLNFSKYYILDNISKTIQNMTKILDEKILQYKNFNSIEYNVWFAINKQYLREKYELIDDLFISKNDKLLFTNYILSTLTICKLENYYFRDSNYEEIIHLQKKINDFNIKLSLINNTVIDVNYIKELNKQNIEIEEYDNNYLNLIITYEIKINKLKKTILELEEMESEISNQIKDNNNKEKTIDIIEQHMRLTKLQKNLKKEIKDNKAKKSKLEINAKKECDIGNFDYKNEYIKHITESQSYYLSEFTNLIKQILNKNIEQITIDKLNIYDIELQQSKDILEHIMLLYKTINDIAIDVNTYNSSNIKNIQTFIQKEIELNTNSSKNIDIIKQKNDEIQNILSININLNLEIDKYNIEIFKLEDEFTTIEKVYNLRKLYTS